MVSISTASDNLVANNSNELSSASGKASNKEDGTETSTDLAFQSLLAQLLPLTPCSQPSPIELAPLAISTEAGNISNNIEATAEVIAAPALAETLSLQSSISPQEFAGKLMVQNCTGQIITPDTTVEKVEADPKVTELIADLNSNNEKEGIELPDEFKLLETPESISPEVSFDNVPSFKNSSNETQGQAVSSILAPLNDSKNNGNQGQSGDTKSDLTFNLENSNEFSSTESSDQIGEQSFDQVLDNQLLSPNNKVESTQNIQKTSNVKAPIETQASDGIQATYNSGKQELTIDLNPENLGKMQIKLSKMQGEGSNTITATLTVNTLEAKQGLEKRVEDLTRSLAEKGIQIGKLDIIERPIQETSAHHQQQSGLQQQSSSNSDAWQNQYQQAQNNFLNQNNNNNNAGNGYNNNQSNSSLNTSTVDSSQTISTEGIERQTTAIEAGKVNLKV